MTAHRRTAISAGVLFIAATVLNVVGVQLSASFLTGSGSLSKLSANAGQVSAGALLEVTAAGACAGIAITLFPVLRMWNTGLSLGSVVFRAVEAVMYLVGAVMLLSLLQLSQQFTNAAPTDRGPLQAVADGLLAVRGQVSFAGVAAFSLGALLYYYLFWRSRLIPRWLSGWGLLAIALTMVACLLSLFSRRPLTDFAVILLPIAIQEMVLAIWLIVRGFDSVAVRSAPGQAQAGLTAAAA